MRSPFRHLKLKTGLEAAFRRITSLGVGGGWWARPPIMIGALGDSITRNQYTSTTPWTGDVGEVFSFTARAWALWACQLSGRRAWCNVEAVEGYSGYRTDQILAAMLPANNTRTIGPSGNQAAKPYGVRAVRPDFCFVMAGTNDLTQGVSSAAAVANLRAIWEALRAGGVEPIAISLLPRDSPAPYAADVPAWNAAIEAAADTDGVAFIDVYTNCDNGSGGFKSGWAYIGGAPDATGLHPGNEACHQMAADIAASLAAFLPALPHTTYVDSATTCVIESGAETHTVDLLSDFGGGIFPSADGWGARYEPNAASTVSVSATSPAEIGNALTVSYGAQSGDGYSDRNGPTAVTVVPGARYAVMARIKFDAGHKNDTLSFSLQGSSVGGNLFETINNGSGTASTNAGASLTARDWYTEILIPPGVTSLRPWIEVRPADGSTGPTLRVAQFGIRAL